MLRSLLVLLLGAMILSEAAGVAPADDRMPPPPERLEPVASFAYVEPVRRDGVVTYVVRVHGGPSAGQITVRVRELSEGGGEGDVLFGSDDGQGTPVTSGAVPGAGPDGRPWPLLFAEPPPPGASNRQFRVELAVNDTVTVQRLGVSAADRRWQTFSRRIRLAARPDAGLPPLAFREAQDQNNAAPRGEACS